jgi:D-glycero-D-manno-heptose 1,7-bisphosphate phosphatase
MLRVFDKDGTLVQTKSGDKFPKLGDQQLIPGVKERIAAYKEAGDIICVASNQAGIPTYKSLEDAISEFQELMQLLPEISVCFFCPNFEGTHCWSVPNPDSAVYLQDTLTGVVYPAGKSSDYGAAKPLHEGTGLILEYGKLVGSYRKPNDGMIKAAMIWARVDTCAYVGDRPEDEGAATNAGVPFQHVNDWLA